MNIIKHRCQLTFTNERINQLFESIVTTYLFVFLLLYIVIWRMASISCENIEMEYKSTVLLTSNDAISIENKSAFYWFYHKLTQFNLQFPWGNT